MLGQEQKPGLHDLLCHPDAYRLSLLLCDGAVRRSEQGMHENVCGVNHAEIHWPERLLTFQGIQALSSSANNAAAS